LENTGFEPKTSQFSAMSQQSNHLSHRHSKYIYFGFGQLTMDKNVLVLFTFCVRNETDKSTLIDYQYENYLNH